MAAITASGTTTVNTLTLDLIQISDPSWWCKQRKLSDVRRSEALQVGGDSDGSHKQGYLFNFKNSFGEFSVGASGSDGDHKLPLLSRLKRKCGRGGGSFLG